MSVGKERNYSLGPLPWDEEVLCKGYFSSPVATRQAIKEHPGYKAEVDLLDLELALEVFLDSVSGLLSSIAQFDKESASVGFWHRGNQNRVSYLEKAIRRGVFAASVSAFALVEVSRRVRGHHAIDGYEEKFRATFTYEQHRFIQCLRNYITHVGLATSSWQVSWSKEGRQTQFLLKNEELLSWEKWDAPAKAHIARYPRGIDLKLLFESYSESVKAFQEWFRKEVGKSNEALLSEYRRYDRLLKSFDWKAFWTVMLRQRVIEGGVDPYQYLQRYLMPDEMAEVLALPKHSKQQVDRIIEIVDEPGLTDDELKQLAYNSFGVET